MSDFTKGVVVFILGFISVLTLFHYIGKVSAYYDGRTNQRMTECQSVGLSYQDCYDHIIFGGRRFNDN